MLAGIDSINAGVESRLSTPALFAITKTPSLTPRPETVSLFRSANNPNPMIKTLKSKLFMIRVTAVMPDYEGSIAIGSEIMEAAGLLKWESVIINHQTNGRSWETYVTESKDPCSCELRGGSVAGLEAGLGDRLVILAWRWDQLHHMPANPAILHFNHVNRLMPWHPE